MEVVIKDMPMRNLAIMEHRGDPRKLGESVGKLFSWARKQPQILSPKPGESFGFAYDDPSEVMPENFRFDLGLTVPSGFRPDDEVRITHLPKGRYAVVTHKGARKDINEKVYSLYRDWLPNSGEELGDLPCVFCYYNFDHEVAETESLTEIWLLLK